ncbi:MAG: hypothetical protein WCK42_02930 [Myxococcaceae bacterium]
MKLFCILGILINSVSALAVNWVLIDGVHLSNLDQDTPIIKVVTQTYFPSRISIRFKTEQEMRNFTSTSQNMRALYDLTQKNTLELYAWNPDRRNLIMQALSEFDNSLPLFMVGTLI